MTPVALPATLAYRLRLRQSLRKTNQRPRKKTDFLFTGAVQVAHRIIKVDEEDEKWGHTEMEWPHVSSSHKGSTE